MDYVFIFVVSFVIVFLSTPTVRYFALKFYVIDKRNMRKIHKKVIAKLGGIAIFLGFLGGLAYLVLLNPDFIKSSFVPFFGLLLCSLLMLLLGIYDDIQGSSAATKFSIQIVVAITAVKMGFVLQEVAVPILGNINLGPWGVPLTVLWLVGIINAINLIDGLDGLASGIILIVSSFLCLEGFLLNEKFIVFVSLALMGANLAFLKYNFSPAKIFMGDSGSLFLGFAVALLGIYRSGSNSVNFFIIPAILLLGLPIVDTALALIRRSLRRQRLFTGDFSHIHHFFVKSGFKQKQTVLLFYLITFCLGLASLSIVYSYRFLQ